jgi:hypothetical protein
MAGNQETTLPLRQQNKASANTKSPSDSVEWLGFFLCRAEFVQDSFRMRVPGRQVRQALPVPTG